MHFLTREQCKEWLANYNRRLPNESPAAHTVRITYPKEPYRYLHYARVIASSIMYREPALLWITEWSIWMENWHLYYKLRQTYADHRQLHEAPGHVFLDYESEDLATFLQLAMLNGWGGYILTRLNFVNVFFSHDEFIDLNADHQPTLDELQKAFEPNRP